jgi:hypothetical protein
VHVLVLATTLLVLPIGTPGAIPAPAAKGFHARLLVALGRDPGRQVVDASGDSTCVDLECSVRLGRAAGADHVLATRAVPEHGHFHLFATLYDVAERRVLARHELLDLTSDEVERTAPDEIAEWLGGALAVPRAARVFVAAPSDPRLASLRQALVERLLTVPSSPVAIVEDPASAGYRAELSGPGVAVVTQVHHVHRYHDGVVDVTLTVTDTAQGRVVVTRRARARLSRRAEHATAEDVRAALIDEAVTSFRQALSLSEVLQPKRSQP